MFNFLAAHYGTVEDIEVVWTLIAFIGAIFSIHNLKEASKDKKALSYIDRKNGRGLIARGAYKTEAARLTVQIIFFVIGLLAMTVMGGSYPPHTPWTIILLGVLFRWGLIISSLLLSLMSYWGFQMRQSIFRDLEQGPTVTLPNGGSPLIVKVDPPVTLDISPNKPDSSG